MQKTSSVKIKSAKFFMIGNLLLCILLLAQSQNTLSTDWQKSTVAAHGKVGAAAMLLETGESQELSADAHFPMQSVYKFPIAMAVLQKVDQGTFTLDQKSSFAKVI